MGAKNSPSGAICPANDARELRAGCSHCSVHHIMGTNGIQYCQPSIKFVLPSVAYYCTCTILLRHWAEWWSRGTLESIHTFAPSHVSNVSMQRTFSTPCREGAAAPCWYFLVASQSGLAMEAACKIHRKNPFRTAAAFFFQALCRIRCITTLVGSAREWLNYVASSITGSRHCSSHYLDVHRD